MDSYYGGQGQIHYSDICSERWVIVWLDNPMIKVTLFNRSVTSLPNITVSIITTRNMAKHKHCLLNRWVYLYVFLLMADTTDTFVVSIHQVTYKLSQRKMGSPRTSPCCADLIATKKRKLIS